MRHVVVMLSILACAGLADFAAAATPAQTCTAAKLKAAGKTAFSVLKCDFKAVRKDEPVDSSCLAKAGERLQRAFGKAEGKGGCTTSGDVGAHQTTVDALESDVLAAITFDPDADSRKCASGKIKEVGKLASKNLACRSKAAKRGEPVDQACLDKASGRLANKFAKLESKGSCTTNGDAAAMATRVEDFAQSIVGLLADTCDATCGDGVVGPGEDCDGVDDAACPGDCDLACSCPTNCGDGVVDGSEECDDGGTVGGDGCSASCTLEDPSARCAGVQSFPGAALDTELVADGLSSPVFVTAPPLDTRRLFIVEQTGTIQVLEDGVRSTFLDISADVTVGGERGLLSMAFHPDYENNGRFFVNYTGTACNGAGGCDTVIARYEVSPHPNCADPASKRVLLTIDQDFSNHNGGQLQFGPDGMLYVGMGDGGSGGDPNNRAQDDGELLGKMLRLDVDVETPPYYAVPADNPNPGAGDPLGLIWSKGLRNPWRFSFDRETADMYIGDVGQNAFEEIDVQEAGSTGGLKYGSATGGTNWGWRLLEGGADDAVADEHCFNPAVACDPLMETTRPVLDYPHVGDACSVTGGYAYRGCALPDLAGTYFYADFCSDFIKTFEYAGSGAILNEVDRTAALQPSAGGTIDSISSFGEDARGELYIVSISGKIFRLVPQ